ncbi:GNAT family N-acetyltransferase [candidate division KSB1 bacterium]|nr:GNAT family N-acetyltransferase [candidate division KSB1 bacterium]
MNIKIATTFSADLLAAINRLLPQLSDMALPLTETSLKKMLDADTTYLFIAKDSQGIWGMLTLATYRIPTAQRAWIEDVVVDASRRGEGIGKKLMLAAIDQAKSNGVTTLELTSRSTRVEANKMYQSLGFVLRETNAYRMRFSKNK